MEQAAILIVDDDRNLRRTLADILETEVFDFKIKGAIFLAEEKKMRLASYISLTETELEPCREVCSGECLCGQALATGEIVITTNSDIDVRHRKCSPVVHGNSARQEP